MTNESSHQKADAATHKAPQTLIGRSWEAAAAFAATTFSILTDAHRPSAPESVAHYLRRVFSYRFDDVIAGARSLLNQIEVFERIAQRPSDDELIEHAEALRARLHALIADVSMIAALPASRPHRVLRSFAEDLRSVLMLTGCRAHHREHPGLQAEIAELTERQPQPSKLRAEAVRLKEAITSFSAQVSEKAIETTSLMRLLAGSAEPLRLCESEALERD